MKSKIELTEQEQGIIEAALNDYWHAAHESLESNSVMMSDGTRRPLGTIEKAAFSQRKDLILPLISRFENL